MSEPARACGTCNICCKIIAIPEVDSPAGAWCRHAKPGKGCAIHGQHPDVCRAFHCEWLLHPEIPEALKPNHSKVVLGRARGQHGPQLLAWCDPDQPAAWRTEPIYSFLRQQTRTPEGAPRPVIVWVGRRIWLLTPEGDADLGEIGGRKTFQLEIGPDGKPIAKILGGATDGG